MAFVQTSVSGFLARAVAKLLVYQYPPGKARRSSPAYDTPGVWLLADEDNVATYFASDPYLGAQFLEFLERGCIGLILVNDVEWVSYGWISQPAGMHPNHLPKWTTDVGAYWIFFCRTQEKYRGQGCYKRMLARMVDLIRDRNATAEILIDTDATNIPSRRAIISAGFIPAGLMTTYRLPSWRFRDRLIYGRWRPDQSHPPLPSAPVPDAPHDREEVLTHSLR
jgi:RimJ/RimL family protein N-acetyltransferase